MNFLLVFIGIFVAIMVIAIILSVISKMKGKIEITPEKYSYSSGETIKGKITFKLKKPVEASELNIRLLGERIDNDHSNKESSSKSTIFDFTQPIDGKKVYSASEQVYDFSIKTPKNIVTNIKGITGTLVKSAMILSSKSTMVKWYLIATLEAKGVNVTKSIQINIA